MKTSDVGSNAHSVATAPACSVTDGIHLELAEQGAPVTGSPPGRRDHGHGGGYAGDMMDPGNPVVDGDPKIR